MALTSLKARVIAATSEQPTVESVAVAVPEQSAGDQLHTTAQGEGGTLADTALTWLERYEFDFTAALPSHISVKAFLSAVRDALPGLVRCSPASLRQALLTCARFGLIPDGRHAVIKREGKTAVFVPMAQGYVDLMYRSGRVGSIHVGMVHQADEWSWAPTNPAPEDFVHRPNVTVPKAERGPVVLAYAFAWLESGARSQVIVLTREDAEEIRDEYSQAYQRAKETGADDSFWHTDFNKMWAKSALRRLHKVVPMSAELVALLKADDAGDAGEVQVVHAPVEETALLAEAEEQHARAEDSQAPEEARPRPLLRKRSRTQPKRRSSRAARKSARR
ncbi:MULTISPECIES: recombinase RecT [unclassified Streptomyces]|uniref:recombinase RecT n=1 Tax=unclassified Streptomyces TaxID=2593676 RepID=UPI00093B334C|nr:recombinase RecT [Streptomyces sp. TSRI0281]OKI34955.1 recombinase RecT [Streptomyces sp. TSRI0281]